MRGCHPERDRNLRHRTFGQSPLRVGSCDAGYFKTGPLSCTPVTEKLCLACEVDSDCGTPGDRCVTVGDGKVCGKDCSAGNLHGTPENECYTGFACNTIAGGPKQCVPTSNTCSCLPGNRGATRTCQSSNGGDTCFGLEICDPTRGWVDCSADSPTGEICNGLDDNCNGLVDEEVAHDPVDCASTNANGTCTATYSCQGVNGWQCPVATPKAETCNFADDNCNSQIDESFLDAQGRYVGLANCGSCGVSCVGAIPNATEVCRASGASARCEVETCDPGFYQVGALTCLPASDASCVPCLTDANCPTPGDRCLALDGGHFCGRDCSVGNKHGIAPGQCSAGYECENRPEIGANVRQCVPESGSCTCLGSDQNDVRTCQRQNVSGTCFGSETLSLIHI